MTERFITNDPTVEVEGSRSFWRDEARRPGGIQQFTASTPKLQSKIVEGVVTIGECCKDCSIEARIRIGEKACDLFELRPRGWRSGFATELCLERSTSVEIAEKISAKDQAFGAVVPRQC